MRERRKIFNLDEKHMKRVVSMEGGVGLALALILMLFVGVVQAQEEFEVEGVILAADTSACPTASFTVQDEESSQTVAVVTDANTVYRNGSCADLLLGVVVEARGQVVNGENLAQRVAFEEEDDDDDDDDDGED